MVLVLGAARVHEAPVAEASLTYDGVPIALDAYSSIEATFDCTADGHTLAGTLT